MQYQTYHDQSAKIKDTLCSAFTSHGTMKTLCLHLRILDACASIRHVFRQEGIEHVLLGFLVVDHLLFYLFTCLKNHSSRSMVIIKIVISIAMFSKYYLLSSFPKMSHLVLKTRRVLWFPFYRWGNLATPGAHTGAGAGAGGMRPDPPAKDWQSQSLSFFFPKTIFPYKMAQRNNK